MPWYVRKSGDKWAIVKKENGKEEVVGHSSSKEKAKASIRARYASEGQALKELAGEK